MTWSERYLATVLKSIPASKRADVERELSSSIADAIEERVGAGEEHGVAERAVLEGLGDPGRLAAAYSGRPTFLIGAELFPLYWRFLSRTIAVAVPFAVAIVAGLDIAASGTFSDALSAGVAAGFNVATQVAFWVTVAFAALEWAGPARHARSELLAVAGSWTLERLPKVSAGRITIGEVVGEVVMVAITLGALLFAAGITTADDSGALVPLFAAEFTSVWLPIVFVIVAIGGIVKVMAYNAGRWTRWLATYYVLLQVALGILLVTIVRSGSVLNPAFSAALGWQDLGSPSSPAMIAIGIGVTLVTAYEIGRVILRARASNEPAPKLGAATRSA